MFWREGPVSPIDVYLAWLKVWHKDMPIVMGVVPAGFERDDFRGVDGIRVIEQEQLHPGRTFREHAEVNAARADSCAKRSARARCDDAGAHGHIMLLSS